MGRTFPPPWYKLQKDGTLPPSILLWTLGVWLIKKSKNGYFPDSKRKTASSNWTGWDYPAPRLGLGISQKTSLALLPAEPLLPSQGATWAPQCLVELFHCLTRLSCLEAASNKHFLQKLFLNIKISIWCNFPSNPTLPKPKLITKATSKSRLPVAIQAVASSNPGCEQGMWNCP